MCHMLVAALQMEAHHDTDQDQEQDNEEEEEEEEEEEDDKDVKSKSEDKSATLDATSTITKANSSKTRVNRHGHCHAISGPDPLPSLAQDLLTKVLQEVAGTTAAASSDSNRNRIHADGMAGNGDGGNSSVDRLAYLNRQKGFFHDVTAIR